MRVTVALAAAAAAVLTAGPIAAEAEAAPCDGTFQYDSEGYVWDFASPLNYGLGTFYDGGSKGPAGTPPGVRSTIDVYDSWGMLFVGEETPANAYALKQNDGCFNEEGGREQVFPKLSIDGLEVQRKVYVSATGLPGARILNVVHNPSAAPRTTSIQVGNSKEGDVGAFFLGSLGSDDDTAVRSSSQDDGAITPADTWAVTSDHSPGPAETNNDLALAHVFDGAGGADRVDLATLTDSSYGLLAYGWRDVTIPAGGTVAYLSYEVQRGVAGANGEAEDEAARNAAVAYASNPLTQVYAGMTDAEIASVRNWPRPAPTASISVAGQPTDREPTALSAEVSSASSVPGSCSGIAYAWDLGGGVTAEGPSVRPQLAAGTREVALTVTNSCGGSATTHRAVTVADATAPTASLRAPRAARLGRLRVRLRSSESGRAAVRLTRAGRTIARATVSLEAGTSKAVRLRATRRAAAGLARRPGRTIRARLAVRVSDSAGNSVRLARRIRIRP